MMESEEAAILRPTTEPAEGTVTEVRVWTGVAEG